MNRARVFLSLGVFIHLSSFVLMALRVEPFYTFFYLIVWWTFILVLSGLNHLLKRNSLLFDRSGEFVWIFLYSIVVWLFFEAYNFRLQNWYYVGVPVESFLRWPACLLAFGTVLPGIFETEKLLGNLGLFEKVKGRGIRVNKALRIRLVLTGVLMLFAPLVSPQLFFPLIWLAFIFLIDPILYTRSGKTNSFLYQAENGDYANLLRIMSAGLICGILWEFWNYWAGSKWIYSIPLFNYIKIFEMPVLGYLGFPVFALECFLLYQLFPILKRNLLSLTWRLPITVALALCYSAVIIYGIDKLTVVTYRVFWN
jgi:hypothetical protein